MRLYYYNFLIKVGILYNLSLRDDTYLSKNKRSGVCVCVTRQVEWNGICLTRKRKAFANRPTDPARSKYRSIKRNFR